MKETLEEAAYKYGCNFSEPNINGKFDTEEDLFEYDNARRDFTKGANWQADKMYSELDMLKAAQYGYNFHKTTQFPDQEFKDSCINNVKQWLTIFNRKK